MHLRFYFAFYTFLTYRKSWCHIFYTHFLCQAACWAAGEPPRDCSDQTGTGTGTDTGTDTDTRHKTHTGTHTHTHTAGRGAPARLGPRV